MPSHENFLPFYAATGYHINELNCVWSTKVVKNLIEHQLLTYILLIAKI